VPNVLNTGREQNTSNKMVQTAEISEIHEEICGKPVKLRNTAEEK